MKRTWSNFKNSLMEKVLKNLLKANNTVTTLEIKNELRKQYSGFHWFQKDISQAMDTKASVGEVSYTDTGNFRIYSDPAMAKVASKKPVSKNPTISRKKAIEHIQNSKGMFFSVKFTKKDGSERLMTCRLSKDHKEPTLLGYMNLYDVKNKSLKKVNLQTLSELKINRITYKIQ